MSGSETGAYKTSPAIAGGGLNKGLAQIYGIALSSGRGEDLIPKASFKFPVMFLSILRL